MENGIYFVTGIGTDVGKSYATGWLAKHLISQGKRVITEKFVQTGCVDSSEDIETHRRIMGTGLLPEDKEGLTAPLIFTYPASPDLAASIDGRLLDLSVTTNAINELATRYDIVLVEGAGGCLVPLGEEYLTADYVADHDMPAIVVTNGQLGSINHTLLTLEALLNRGVDIAAVVWNPFSDNDMTIVKHTKAYLQKWLELHTPETEWLEMPQEI